MDRNAINAKGREIWDSLTKDERAGVKFAMFPYDKMTAAEKEGYPTRELCVAVMDAGKA